MELKYVLLCTAVIALSACKEEKKPVKTPEAVTESPTKASQKPFIVPPIPDLNPSYQSFELDVERGATFRLPNNTHIVVPPNAFASKTGQTLKGRVQLRYRELHDALSIYLAGIPMDYRDGHLTTAGSFELRGFQNNNDNITITRPITVKMASFTEGVDYNFYYLNENDRRWDSIGWRKPEINYEKRRLLQNTTKPTLSFPMNRDFFAFNYMSIVDVYYNDDWSILSSDRKTDSAFNAIKTKLEAYGLGWENTYCDNRSLVNFEGQDYPAALFVWKNVNKTPFPEWSRGKNGFLTKKSDKRYLFTLHKNETDSAQIELEAAMPLNALFAFSPEEWKTKREANMAKIRAEHARAKMLADVYRTFEVNQFGLYNWDKPLKEDKKVIVNAEFHFPTKLNERLTDVDMIYISGDNRAVITYPKVKWSEMALLPDKRGRLFNVLPDNKIALYGIDKYGRLQFDDWLKTNTSPQFQFKLDEKNAVKTKEDLKRILQI